MRNLLKFIYNFSKSFSYALLIFLISSNLFGASFNCNKAKTDIEKGICNDPKLSKLDSEIADIYQKFDKNSIYYRQIYKIQKEWISKDRYLSDFDFERQRNFLKWSLDLTKCMENKSLDNTNLSNLNIFETCSESSQKRNWPLQCDESNFGMKFCSQVEMKVYNFMEKALSKYKEQYYVDPSYSKVLSNFRKARQAWLNYRDAECEFGYSTFQGGSIAGLIYSSCIVSFDIERIKNDLLRDPYSLCGDNC